MTRAHVVAAAAGLQVLTLAYMAGEREAVLATGRTVWLRTAPVDPRDAFRGDYVRLRYDIGSVATNRLRGALAETAATNRPAAFPADTRVYAALRDDGGSVAEINYLTGERPRGGVFLRGRTQPWHRGFSALPVRYGIEAMFVQQDKGRDIERRMRDDGDGVQVPMEVAAAVRSDGLAVLKGYRWSALGIGMRFERATNDSVRAATLVLRNASSNDLAIVELPDGRSLELRLEPGLGWGNVDWEWVGKDEPRPAASNECVRVLGPGESHPIRVDFSRPEWFVRRPGKPPCPIYESEPGDMWRLVYRAPPAEDCGKLELGAKVWIGELPGRAFSGRGLRVD